MNNKILLAAFALTMTCPAFAQSASESSILELLKVTKTSENVDFAYQQLEPMMNNIFQSASKQDKNLGNNMTQQKLENFSKKYTALVKQELSWKKLQPEFVKIYSSVYTQEEVDGLIKFYKSPVGQSTIDKMPLVSKKSMEIMQIHMTDLMPKLQKLAIQELGSK